MKTRLVHYRFLLCAIVICGLLAGLTLTGSETHAFDLKGIGEKPAPGLTETDPGSIPGVAKEQADRTKLPATKGPTLECCKCLGGTSTLDLSTISSNNWIVTDSSNGVSSPAVAATPSTAWNINPGSANWVSTVASGGTAGVSPPNTTYDYKLTFFVPDCVIERRVSLSGTYGGDNYIAVYLDNVGNLISSCASTGGYCFNTSNAPQPITSYVVPAGPHTLIVRVKNISGPSGMFINAKLTGTCRN